MPKRGRGRPWPPGQLDITRLRRVTYVWSDHYRGIHKSFKGHKVMDSSHSDCTQIALIRSNSKGRPLQRLKMATCCEVISQVCGIHDGICMSPMCAVHSKIELVNIYSQSWKGSSYMVKCIRSICFASADHVGISFKGQASYQLSIGHGLQYWWLLSSQSE